MKESDTTEAFSSQPSRLKRLAATKCIQKSLAKLEAVELQQALPHLSSHNDFIVDQSTSASASISSVPVLEVGNRDADPMKSNIDIPIELRKSLTKEERLLFGLPPDSTTSTE